MVVTKLAVLQGPLQVLSAMNVTLRCSANHKKRPESLLCITYFTQRNKQTHVIIMIVCEVWKHEHAGITTVVEANGQV
jgi:hypothetical protein